MPIAVALFEPHDPTKKPMYAKHLVYQGVTEFSFEELRGVSKTKISCVYTFIVTTGIFDKSRFSLK